MFRGVVRKPVVIVTEYSLFFWDILMNCLLLKQQAAGVLVNGVRIQFSLPP